MTGPKVSKLAVFAAAAFMLMSCADQFHADSQPLAQALATDPLTTDRVGWTTIDFVDLIERTNSQCVIESGNLVRCAGRLHVDGLTKTWVRGHGTRVEFLDPRPGKGGIEMDNASDVTLSDIEIGWMGGGARDSTPAGGQRIQSFGDVAVCAKEERGGALVLDQPLDGMVPLGAVSVWNDAIGWPWFKSAPDGPEVYFPRGTVAAFHAGRSDCLRQLAGLVGRHVLVRHFLYANHAFACVGCRNIIVENVRVTSAPGIAFVFGNGGSNLILRHDKVEPKCSPNCTRPEPSVTADCAHFNGVDGNILVEDSDFGWQGDDSVNVTGMLAPFHVENQIDGSEGWLRADESARAGFSMFAIGNKVLLFDHGLNALGEASIQELDPTSLRLRLSELPVATGDVLMARADYLPRKVTIRNNHFHDHRARGILMGGSDSVIENNVIERVTMEAILVFATIVEGPGAQHVLIRGNKISDVNRYTDARNYPSAISAGVHLEATYTGSVGTPIRDVVVEGNSFAHIYSNSEIPVFFGRGVVGGKMRDNITVPDK